MNQDSGESLAQAAFEIALLSDVGTNRPNNEDACGHAIERNDAVVFAVADGVGGYEGGEIASRMAIDITLQSFRESPPEWGPAKRLQRAVQNANIEIHNRALVVPELRRMATTLTAVSIDNGTLNAAHVGDCRLYLVRGGRAVQISKDHTMVGERVRMGLMSEARARSHPERSMLLRSLGHELIVSVDRITMALQQGDELILCSDGLYNVLEDADLHKLTRGLSAPEACSALIDAANQRGTADNLTVAFFRMLGETPDPPPASGLRHRLKSIFTRRG
jgi:serine/threonine protein phosphatase PrpC